MEEVKKKKKITTRGKILISVLACIIVATGIGFFVKNRQSMFMSAVKNGDVGLCRLYVFFGADVNKGYGPNTSPLFVAAEKGYLEICKYLVSKGAKINIRTRSLTHKKSYVMTPLYKAAEKGHLDVCVFLVKAGADVNASHGDRSDTTALMYAAQEGHADICKLLVSEGAYVNAKDYSGATALTLAYLYNKYNRAYSDTIDYLESVGAIRTFPDYAKSLQRISDEMVKSGLFDF